MSRAAGGWLEYAKQFGYCEPEALTGAARHSNATIHMMNALLARNWSRVTQPDGRLYWLDDILTACTFDELHLRGRWTTIADFGIWTKINGLNFMFENDIDAVTFRLLVD